MTIADNLITLNNTKQNIKTAIEAKGVDMTGVAFTDYDTKIGEIVTGGGGYTRTWTRPSDWLAMPTMTVGGQQMIAILMAIRDKNDNYMAFQIQGAFTVDWGDGVVENFASNAIAVHNYSFSNPVFNGTTTTEGFKQALIKITPQAGNNLTYANFDHTGYPTYSRTGVAPSKNNIEMAFNTPLIGGSNLILRGSSCTQYLVRIITFFDIGNFTTQTSTFFQDMTSLEMVFIENNKNCFKNATSYNNMFNRCYSLIEGPDFNMNNTGSNIFMTSMFNSCYALKWVPTYDTSKVTIMNSTFLDCRSLLEIPPFNTSLVTTMESAFRGTRAISKFPLINTANVTTMNSAFYDSGVTEIPELDLSSVTDTRTMLRDTFSLNKIPSTLVVARGGALSSFDNQNIGPIQKLTANITAGTTASYAFYQGAFKEVNITTTNTITTFTNTFNNCNNLQKVSGNLNMSGATTTASMFSGCPSLIEITGATAPTSGAVTTTSMFNGCTNLERIDMPGMANTFSVINCNLGVDGLNELYTGLATVTGKTITVTGNPGVSGDNPAIATAKGWTVVG